MKKKKEEKEEDKKDNDDKENYDKHNVEDDSSIVFPNIIATIGAWKFHENTSSVSYVSIQ